MKIENILFTAHHMLEHPNALLGRLDIDVELHKDAVVLTVHKGVKKGYAQYRLNPAQAVKLLTWLETWHTSTAAAPGKGGAL